MEIWDKWDAAFKGVSAVLITDNYGCAVAKVGLKYARSGLRTTCYLHIISFSPVIGYANGGGYDKASAAVNTAARKITVDGPDNPYAKIIKVLAEDHGGQRWKDAVLAADFRVYEVL